MKISRWLFSGTLAVALALTLLIASAADGSGNPNIHAYPVGAFEVILLSEGGGESDTSRLIYATEEQIKKYVPTGKYSTATNTFLVRTKDRVLLVDTGYGRELFKNLETVGVRPEEIDTVLLTHMHGDHIGGLLRDGKVAFPGAAVYLARQERDYWTDETLISALPEDRQRGFRNAVKTLNAYGDAVRTFEPASIDFQGEELLPGVRAVAAFGHTPGHTLFMIESEGAKLLIWGDLTHASAIQTPLPRVAMTYDVDPRTAVATRLAIMKYAAENKIPVAGMHIPLPGMGTLAAQTEGGYTFTPVRR